MRDHSLRKIQKDSKGSLYVRIPSRFARILGLKDKEKVELRLVSSNKIELRKRTE
jgi:antitoxin component of MazEF toxin-antitoxin module